MADTPIAGYTDTDYIEPTDQLLAARGAGTVNPVGWAFGRRHSSGNWAFGNFVPGQFMDAWKDLAAGQSVTFRMGGVGAPSDQYSVRLRFGLTALGVPFAQLLAPLDTNGYLEICTGDAEAARIRIHANGNVEFPGGLPSASPGANRLYRDASNFVKVGT